MESIQNYKNIVVGYIQSQNSNVLSSLNHQLRTPLQGITSCAGVLQNKSDDTTHKNTKTLTEFMFRTQYLY